MYLLFSISQKNMLPSSVHVIAILARSISRMKRMGVTWKGPFFSVLISISLLSSSLSECFLLFVWINHSINSLYRFVLLLWLFLLFFHIKCFSFNRESNDTSFLGSSINLWIGLIIKDLNDLLVIEEERLLEFERFNIRLFQIGWIILEDPLESPSFSNNFRI